MTLNDNFSVQLITEAMQTWRSPHPLRVGCMRVHA
jgi:hypothetical protein